jgi:hypothetical protein
MIIKGFFGESELPDNKLWIKDSIENRYIFTSKFGNPRVEFPDFAYIEFDINEKSWTTTPSFAWLYTNQPPLTDIKFFINL